MGRGDTVLGWLVQAASGGRPDDLADIAARAARRFGAADLTTYVVDYRQTCLIPLPQRGPARPVGEPLGLDSTVGGRAYTSLRAQETAGEDGVRLWLPIFNGADRMGAVEVRFDQPPTDHQRSDALAVSQLLAELLSSRRSSGDAIELARRLEPMQLAAEMAWSVLPPLTLVADEVCVSGILEPSYDVGGDSFDYALNGGLLHLALFDAVGHGLSASRLTTLTMAAYRNARRAGIGLVETAESIDAQLRQFAPPSAYVTAILAQLDLASGTYRRVSAGHPGELLVRDGRAITQLTAPTGLPLGLSDVLDRPTEVDEVSLQPGDAIIMYSDGMSDARNAMGEFFGTARLADSVTKAFADALPPAETMRRLVRTVVEHQNNALTDDATAVLLQWRHESPTTTQH